jgi:hypothetical protein
MHGLQEMSRANLWELESFDNSLGKFCMCNCLKMMMIVSILL